MTACAFAAFGIGGVLLAYLCVPIVSLLAPPGPRREKRVQYLIHLSFRIFLRFLRGMGVIEIYVDGESSLSSCRGKLIVANHPTLLDVVILVALNPRIHCVVKPQLWSNPFLKDIVSAAGYINSDLPVKDLIAAANHALGSGSNLLIFPEGTRTQLGAPRQFQRGFANIAILTGAQIQTTIISCNPITLTKNLPWYDIPLKRPVFHVRAGECLDVSHTTADTSRALAARQIVSDVEAYFRGVLSDDRSRNGAEGIDRRRLKSGGSLA